MALQTYPIEHFAILQDRGGNKFRLAWFSTGTVLTTAQGLNDAMVSSLTDITQCLLIEAGFIVRQVEDDQTPLDTHGEGEKKAAISVSLVTETPPNPGQTKKSTITIPAPIDDLFLSNSAGPAYNIVDVENADLITFLEQFYAGVGILPSLTLSDFQTIKDPNVAANLTGKRVTRRSSKG